MSGGERGASHADMALVRRALAGDEAACAVIVREIAPRVEASVLRLCSDGASRQRARDIASEVISDCFGATARPRGHDVLLTYYDGRAPLVNWLCAVAASRLRNWWKSGRARFEVAEREAGIGALSGRAREDVGSEASGFPEEIGDLLALGLGRAFECAPRKEMVWLRLAFLHGIPKGVIARIWNVHPSGVSRGVASCLEGVRSDVMAYLRGVDPYLEVAWGDCLAVCERMIALASGDIGRGR